MADPRPKNEAERAAGSGTQPVVRRLRRQSTRVPVTIAVTLMTPDGEFMAAATDLGIGGMFLVTEHSLDYGADIEVRIRDVTLPATVRWVNQEGVGVQFKALGANATRLIVELMKRSAK